MSMIRVLIADDHVPTRAELREVLEANGFEVCTAVGSAEAAVAAAIETSPNVALLDIRMPGNGLAAAAQIGAMTPNTVVVMLTVSREESDLFDALRVGAVGFLPKETNFERIPIVLKRVLAGEAALPRHLVALVIDEFRGREGRRLSVPADRRVRLTPREWEVLELMRDGLETSEIATRLFVTEVTVRTHVAGILRKLKVSDRESAVRLIDRHWRPDDHR